jgi:YegS/Rv2252/BmrU family lipid kinase
VPVVVIINPVSGPRRRGSAEERVRHVRETFARLGVAAETRLTERPLHAFDMARDAVQFGINLVIAWGGDGTINEVGRALAFSSTALGIVPGGSGNGLSRELNIPFDPPAALERAIRSKERSIDAGELEGRMFFNIAGIGLDAHVAHRVATRVHHRGLLPYLMSTARDLFKYKPADYSVETDVGTFEGSAMMIALANSKQYGFNARIAPDASYADGLLDLVLVEDRRLAGNLLRVPTVFVGRFHRQRGVRVLKVRHARIRAASPMLLHVDGEPLQARTDATARVHPGALRVRA